MSKQSGLGPHYVVFIRVVTGWTLKDTFANSLLTNLAASILQGTAANVEQQLLEPRRFHKVLTCHDALY